MELKSITVIGAGTMGSGIAQWFAQQYCRVQLVDNSQDQLNKALTSIHQSWAKLIDKGKLTLSQVEEMKQCLQISSLEEVTKNCDLVIEAIIENLEIKKELFLKLHDFFSPETIFSSNTSSFPITSLSSHLPAKRSEKFLGLHFFNPATLMPLVEIIQGENTDKMLCQNLYHWFEQKGKKPALCKDSPGFIVNRVARNFYGEPLRIAEVDNEAKLKEIDFILKEVGGFKMGPFELMDLIGIDINYSVTCSVWEAFHNEPRFAPHSLQKKMVDEKRFGRKTKKGFYQYD